jgi:hypothetical protein
MSTSGAESQTEGLEPEELKKRLKLEKVRHFDKLIPEMSKDELREHFGAKSSGKINLSLFIKNSIWQAWERIEAGTLAGFRGNIRSFWYAMLKPALSRADALTVKSDPYQVMIDMFVRLVMVRQVLRYRGFGFTDEARGDRLIGGKNRHILVVAEKRGHFPLLQQIAEDFDVTVFSLGGQPSLLSTEYFVDELKAAGVDISETFPLLTIVDYDPAGDSIARTFMRQMQEFGVGELLKTDLVRPQNMTPEQVQLNKYRLSRAKSERKKIARWLGETGGVNKTPYGLEANAMPEAQLLEVFEREVAVFLRLGVEEVKRRRQKKRLSRALQRLILRKLGLG